jgi:prepilin-type N-terminal cleavage/methylation domain-containing protein
MAQLLQRSPSGVTMRSRTAHGFTLVELMIVVGIVGILSAIAIPAFTRYIRKSRTSEVAGHLNKMWAGSVTYYMSDFTTVNGATGQGMALAKQFPGPNGAWERDSIDCCTMPGGRCPGGATVWGRDLVWLALKFSIPDAHNYIPGYTSSDTGTNAKFTASALGDLNCNFTNSEFRRDGFVTSTGDVAGQVQAVVIREFE